MSDTIADQSTVEHTLSQSPRSRHVTMITIGGIIGVGGGAAGLCRVS